MAAVSSRPPVVARGGPYPGPGPTEPPPLNLFGPNQFDGDPTIAATKGVHPHEKPHTIFGSPSVARTTHLSTSPRESRQKALCVVLAKPIFLLMRSL